SLQDNFFKEAEKSLIMLESYLARYRESAEILSSRTSIREDAWRYFTGDISLEEIRSSTGPKWRDGVDALKDLAFAARYVKGDLIASEGNLNGSGDPLAVSCEETTLDIIQGQDPPILLVCSPIRDRGTLLGYDVIGYPVSAFLSTLNGDTSLHRLVDSDGPAGSGIEDMDTSQGAFLRRAENETSVFLPVKGTQIYLESYISNTELYKDSDLLARRISLWFGALAVFLAFALAFMVHRRNLSQLFSMKRLQEQLQSSEERYRILFEKESDMVLVQQLDPQTRESHFIEANDSALETLGYTREELLTHPPSETLICADNEEMIHFLRKLTDDRHVLWEMLALSSQGKRIPVEVHSHLFEMEGKTTILTVARDISERKEVERALRENETRYSSIFRNSEAVMLLVDPRSGKIEDANESACAFFDYTCRELIGESLSRIVSTEPSELFRMMQLATTDQKKHFFLESRLSHGSIRQVEVYVSNIEFTGKDLLFLIIHDLTEEREAERKIQKLNEELLHLSNTDKLTGVINRRHFEEILGWEIDKARRYKDTLSLVMFDLDRFKEINDRFGHKRGDLVLREICSSCRSNIRSSDFLARWGGDEFMILTPVKLQEALILGEKIRKLVADLDLGVTASVGVTEFVPGDNMDTLTTRVDDLLYEAKEKGRNLVVKG
ncbi:MAG TPA: sensor domain-containing diguanylate cyclase, partial [Synergistales bacterium]|nr:sensor domain-containing diguanylate cyclase [Synergistales bacterium]